MGPCERFSWEGQRARTHKTPKQVNRVFCRPILQERMNLDETKAAVVGLM